MGGRYRLALSWRRWRRWRKVSYTTTLAKIGRDALKAWPPYSIEPTKTCPNIWVNGFNQVVQIHQSKNIWIDDDTIWVDDQSNHRHLEGETGLGEVEHKAGMDGCRYGCHNDTCEYSRVPRNGGFRETFRYIWWQTVRSDRAK
jgi:hypothetical protein